MLSNKTHRLFISRWKTLLKGERPHQPWFNIRFLCGKDGKLIKSNAMFRPLSIQFRTEKSKSRFSKLFQRICKKLLEIQPSYLRMVELELCFQLKRIWQNAIGTQSTGIALFFRLTIEKALRPSVPINRKTSLKQLNLSILAL